MASELSLGISIWRQWPYRDHGSLDCSSAPMILNGWSLVVLEIVAKPLSSRFAGVETRWEAVAL
jgi:hypothetical protein